MDLKVNQRALQLDMEQDEIDRKNINRKLKKQRKQRKRAKEKLKVPKPLRQLDRLFGGRKYDKNEKELKKSANRFISDDL